MPGGWLITYEQEVAVKLIGERGFSSSELRGRFLAERQLLAELEHPNIARLLDGGTTEDGRPFLVMELVKGESIDVHCARHELSIRQRLRLFLRVCDAVRYAHQHRVVHRDIKPANILVTADGIPKLLDFGIAKDLGERASAPVTQLFSPLTPQYASPELLTGQSVTTMTDVYSLGVVLYELLVGHRPFRESADPLAERRSPRPPSLGLREQGDAGPRHRWRQLAGDLDHIVLRAIAAHEAERYASVEQLVDDLERYLSGRPLSNRGGVLYRTGKFIRRRWQAIAAVAGLLILSGFLVSKELNRVQLERENQRVTDLSYRLGNYLVEIFTEADPTATGEHNEALERILDRGSQLLAGRELVEEPEMRAVLLGTIGQVYRRLDQPRKAEPLLRECLELRRQMLPSDDELIALAANNLAQAQRSLGHFIEAQALLGEALRIFRRSADEIQIAAVLGNLSGVEVELGQLESAVAHAEESLALRERHAAKPAALARAHKNLGISLRAAGRLDEAEAYLRQALGSLSGPYARAGVEQHLGAVLREKGDLEQARRLLESSYKVHVEHHGVAYRKSLEVLFELALLHRDAGQKGEAEALLQQLIDLRAAEVGEEHPDIGWALANLASLQVERGHGDRAVAMANRALEILRQRLPEDHRRIQFVKDLLNEID